jgi:hypothetical protein
VFIKTIIVLLGTCACLFVAAEDTVERRIHTSVVIEAAGDPAVASHPPVPSCPAGYVCCELVRGNEDEPGGCADCQPSFQDCR